MKLESFVSELTEAILQKLEVIHVFQEQLTGRWFEKGDDGVKREVTERFELFESNGIKEFPVIGMERPLYLEVEKAKVEINTDVYAANYGDNKLAKLFAKLFTGSEKTSELTLTIEFKPAQMPPGGLLAIHKRAERIIREACMESTPVTPNNTSDEVKES